MNNLLKKPGSACLFFLLCSTMLVQSGFSQTLTFQGTLRDPSDRTVEDGEYDLTFRIYTSAIGGTELWTELLEDVYVAHGVFAVELGAVNDLTPLTFSETYWLGVSIEDAEEISVRRKLSTVPYSLAVRGTANTFPSTGNVGVGNSDPTDALVLNNDDGTRIGVNSESGDPAGFAFETGGTERWRIELEPSSGVLNFVESSGSETLTCADGGLVGIGTTNPQARLHVAGDSNGTVDLTVSGRIRTTGSENGLQISDDRIIGSDATGNLNLEIDGSPRVTVTPMGNVGIGTEYPSRQLHVNGNVQLSDGGAILFDDGTSMATTAVGGSSESLSNTGNAVINADNDGSGSGSVQLLTNNTTRLTIANDGNVGIGTTSPSNTLDVAGDVNFSGSLLKNASAFITTPWQTNGSDIFYNDGKVGIGTSSPQYALDVAGTINATGSILKNGSEMTAQWYEPDNWYEMLVSNRNMIITENENDYAYATLLKENAYNAPVYIYGDVQVIPASNNSQGKYVLFPKGGTSFYPNGSGNSYIGANDSWRVYTGYIGNLYCGNYGDFSDRRVKQNIHPLENALEQVRHLNGVRYDINTETHPFFKGREVRDGELTEGLYGFIAQDLQEIIPELVTYDEQHELYMIRNYHQILPVFVKAMQELKGRNDELQAEINTAMQELEQLQQELGE